MSYKKPTGLIALVKKLLFRPDGENENPTPDSSQPETGAATKFVRYEDPPKLCPSNFLRRSK